MHKQDDEVEVTKPGDANDGRAGKVAHVIPRAWQPARYVVDFHGEGVGEYSEWELKRVEPVRAKP